MFRRYLLVKAGPVSAMTCSRITPPWLTLFGNTSDRGTAQGLPTPRVGQRPSSHPTYQRGNLLGQMLGQITILKKKCKNVSAVESQFFFDVEGYGI